jgi:hypothetical protein
VGVSTFDQRQFEKLTRKWLALTKDGFYVYVKTANGYDKFPLWFTQAIAEPLPEIGGRDPIPTVSECQQALSDIKGLGLALNEASIIYPQSGWCYLKVELSSRADLNRWYAMKKSANFAPYAHDLMQVRRGNGNPANISIWLLVP